MVKLKKWLAVVLLCILAAGTIVAYVAVTWNRPKRPPAIGIFYYVWYNPAWTVSWDPEKIVDEPVLGRYNSSDPAIIRQHILWLNELGVDFVVISWWGASDDYGRFNDRAAQQFFEALDEMTAANAEANGRQLRAAIMVEAFNKTGSAYHYDDIYQHIYDTFVLPHMATYYGDPEPILCFFNDDVLTPSGVVPLDERFTVVLVGQSDYVDWIYTDLNYYVKPSRIPMGRQISVTPRFDDSRLGRPQSCIVDPTLTQGVYDREWENATRLWLDGKIDTIMITSWNEYPERTAIEPHTDATAANNDPNLLFDMTQDHITRLRQLAQ